jgi:hypothetical protein
VAVLPEEAGDPVGAAGCPGGDRRSCREEGREEIGNWGRCRLPGVRPCRSRAGGGRGARGVRRLWFLPEQAAEGVSGPPQWTAGVMEGVRELRGVWWSSWHCLGPDRPPAGVGGRRWRCCGCCAAAGGRGGGGIGTTSEDGRGQGMCRGARRGAPVLVEVPTLGSDDRQWSKTWVALRASGGGARWLSQRKKKKKRSKAPAGGRWGQRRGPPERGSRTTRGRAGLGPRRRCLCCWRRARRW